MRSDGRRDNEVTYRTRRPRFVHSIVAAISALMFTVSINVASAQNVSVVGQSSSLRSTTDAARKTFYDEVGKSHWAFWFDGRGISYASSRDSQSWISHGTISHKTPYFSVAAQVIDGTSYVFLVTESGANNIVVRRGAISGASVTWTASRAVYAGTGPTNRYLRPCITLDKQSHLWIAAIHDAGIASGERYKITATRSLSSAAARLSFQPPTEFGEATATLTALSLVPRTGPEVVLIASGQGGTNITGYHYDGANWSEVTSGGDVGRYLFASAGGTDGVVNALVFDGSGNLYAGGSFSLAGGVGASNIARWDGSKWHSLDFGVDGPVNALAVDASDSLYVGGRFSTAGSIAVSHIAKWNGASWSALGQGVNDEVYALTVSPTGTLYVGGAFSTAGGAAASFVATWDGSAWGAVGTGVDQNVYAIAIRLDGVVVVGGAFTHAGGATAQHIATWDGTSWSTLGLGVNDDVRALLFWNDDSLIAGGGFTLAGGAPAAHIARWNGSSWNPLGAGTDNNVLSLVIDERNNLVAGGLFLTAGGSSTNRIASWDGASWTALDAGMNDSVNAVAHDGSDTLFAGGLFTSAAGSTALHTAAWSGSEWNGLGAGLDSFVRAITVDDSGNVFVAGDFTSIGPISANRIAMWNGTTWASLGAGLNDTVYALATDGARRVFAVGKFTTANGASASRIAFWDGSSWASVGAGVDNTVYAVSLTANGDLIIGGEFTTAGSAATSHIALWDGASWTPLGTGMNDTVYAIASGEDGRLFAGGDFTTAGGVSASRIAEWDGTSWNPLGSGVNASVFTLAMSRDNDLFAGGAFSTAGGSAASFIAHWDGHEWNPVGDGLNSIVFSLNVAPNGSLAAAGVFTHAGSVPVNRIATWDGATWSPTGRGIDSAVSVVTYSRNGTLYAGGVYGLGYIKPVGVNDQRAGSLASVLGASNQTFVTYITNDGDVRMRNISGAPPIWGDAIRVHLGNVASQATGYLPLTETISTWFIENGAVYHRESSVPYRDWSSPQVVSSVGTPRSISTEVSASYSPNKIVAIWNRGGETRGEVVAAHHIETPPASAPDPRCERIDLRSSLQRIELALLSIRNRANFFAAKGRACGGKNHLHDREKIIGLGKLIRTLSYKAWGGTIYACPVYACERRSVRPEVAAITKYARSYGRVARSIAQTSAISCQSVSSRGQRRMKRDSIDFTNRLLGTIQALPSAYSICR